MGYGRRGGGMGYGAGRWPGNGPFRDLPPWERPGWLYGPGSCWTLGYWRNAPPLNQAAPPIANEPDMLRKQRDLLEAQLRNLQESIERIEKRLSELES